MNEMDILVGNARASGLWFWSRYQNLWFSPDELAEHQANGRFRWGPDNWELCDPAEHLAELRRTVDDAAAQVRSFEERMARVVS